MALGAIQLQQLSNKYYKKRIPLLPGLIYRWIHFRYNCDISPITKIGYGTILGHGGISVVINSDAIIGRHCILAQNVTITKHKGLAPILDDCVYVGHGSIIMGGGKLARILLSAL